MREGVYKIFSGQHNALRRVTTRRGHGRIVSRQQAALPDQTCGPSTVKLS